MPDRSRFVRKRVKVELVDRSLQISGGEEKKLHRLCVLRIDREIERIRSFHSRDAEREGGALLRYPSRLFDACWETHWLGDFASRSLSDLARLSEGVAVRVRIFMSLRNLCEHK